MVLQGQPCGRVGRCRGFEGSVERLGPHLFSAWRHARTRLGLLTGPFRRFGVTATRIELGLAVGLGPGFACAIRQRGLEPCDKRCKLRGFATAIADSAALVRAPADPPGSPPGTVDAWVELMHAERHYNRGHVLGIEIGIEIGTARCSACTDLLPLESLLSRRAIRRLFCDDCLERGRGDGGQLELGGES